LEGSDADLVVWDPECIREIRGETMQSAAGYSVYDGRLVQGWPKWTVRRGEVVLDSDGSVHAEPGSGRIVARSLRHELRTHFKRSDAT
jgi:dihydropyrimidinase